MSAAPHPGVVGQEVDVMLRTRVVADEQKKGSSRNGSVRHGGASNGAVKNGTARNGSAAAVATAVLPEARLSIQYPMRKDQELVRLAQAGDTRAFDELVLRYQQRVYRLAYKILRNEDDAAETLQETFLSAYRGIVRFKHESTFSTWLYRIATNAALMRLRRRRDHLVSLDQSQSDIEDPEPLAIADWSRQPLQELLDSETREVMEDGIKRLPERLRAVFVLRVLEEIPNDEVGQILSLTGAAVKSRLHRARLLLRDRLNRYFTDRMTRLERLQAS
jgi:RNA polymerase sigma-70 factor (ECF subfamily)